MFDREEIFRWIARKDWNRLLDFVHDNSEIADSDEIVQTGIQTFVQQFVTEIESGGSTDPNFEWYLEKIILLHKSGRYQVPDEAYKVVSIEIVKRHSDNLPKAYAYAKNYPGDEICAAVIKRYKDSQPKRVQHSQSDQIRVSQNAGVANVDHTRPLFKSQQEFDFYRAVVEVFPTHVVYPNVALSCLIEYKQIESQLSSDERRHVFTGIVDCVVFDAYRAHKPIWFFELDSIFHDTDEQKVKDGYKDKILALAGQKLYRIRKMGRQVSQSEFVTLIREVLAEGKS